MYFNPGLAEQTYCVRYARLASHLVCIVNVYTVKHDVLRSLGNMVSIHFHNQKQSRWSWAEMPIWGMCYYGYALDSKYTIYNISSHPNSLRFRQPPLPNYAVWALSKWCPVYGHISETRVMWIAEGFKTWQMLPSPVKSVLYCLDEVLSEIQIICFSWDVHNYNKNFINE